MTSIIDARKEKRGVEMEQNPSNFNQANGTVGVAGSVTPQQVTPAPNNKPKKNLWLIIAAAVVVLVGIIVGVVLATKGNGGGSDNGGSDNNGSNGGSAVGANQISSISADFTTVVALSGDGTLYGVGEVEGLGGNSTAKVEEPAVLAKNVSSFIDDNTLYYLDKSGTLYRAGLNYDGGLLHTFEETYSNVVSYDTFSGFCLAVVTKSGDAYITNGKLGTKNYCGLTESTDGFKKVASSVKKVVTGYHFNGYINNNNELWIASSSDKEYSKKLDNVIDDGYDQFTHYFLTSDGNLYKIDASSYDTELVETGVASVGDGFIKKKDGDYYIYVDEGYYYPFDLTEVTEKDGYYKVSFEDGIQEIYYVYFVNSMKIVYLNKQGKIVMVSYNKEPKVVDNTISSIKDILDFINNKY